MSISEPYFSVVMPLYNHAAWVTQAVESVLAQSFANFEIVICNDGSTDESLSIVREFRDSRIKVISKPNSGPAGALNSAIFETKGKVICWLSADDYFMPKKLEAHFDLHEAYPCWLSIAPSGLDINGSVTLENLPKIDKSTFLHSFIHTNPINGLSVAIDRRVFLKLGLFDSRYRYSHDFEFWLRTLKVFEPVYMRDFQSPLSITRVGSGFLNDGDMNPYLCGRLDNVRVLLDYCVRGGLDIFLPDWVDKDSGKEFLTDWITDELRTQKNYFYQFGFRDIFEALATEFLVGDLSWRHQFHPGIFFNRIASAKSDVDADQKAVEYYRANWFRH